MPTPLELVLDPVSLAIIGLYAALIAWEAMFPARALPFVKGWKARGLAAFCAFFLLSSYLPFLWSEHLAHFQLFDIDVVLDAGALTRPVAVRGAVQSTDTHHVRTGVRAVAGSNGTDVPPLELVT